MIPAYLLNVWDLLPLLMSVNTAAYGTKTLLCGKGSQRTADSLQCSVIPEALSWLG